VRPVIAILLFVVSMHAAIAGPRPPLLSDYTHTSWGATEGVPAGVNKIAQSTDGWLWLATEKGLYRYDGVRFERMDAVYGHRLFSSNVLNVMTARDGSLWVAYRGGGLSMFGKSVSRDYLQGNDTAGTSVMDIEEAPDGSVWVATAKGAMRIAQGGMRFELQGHHIGLPDAAVYRILFSRDGTQWIAAMPGVFLRKPGASGFTLIWPKETIRVVSIIACPWRRLPSRALVRPRSGLFKWDSTATVIHGS
jgi:ligand-binding sensor domain-containing protein